MTVINTPLGVLRSIAHRLGCRVDEIEAVLVREFGGDLVRHYDPERRLDAIRRKLGVAEACSVIDAAAELRLTHDR